MLTPFENNKAQHNQKSLTRVSVLPILPVLAAAAANNVNSSQKHTKNGANSDYYVECGEVAVDMLREVGIIKISCALFDCRHVIPEDQLSSMNPRKFT